MIFAYTRISTKKDTQKHDRQVHALIEYSKENNFTIDEFFHETESGKNFEDRKVYKELRNKLRQGDILLVSDIDRLSRNADELINEMKDFKLKGIKVVALDIPYLNRWDKTNDDSIHDMIVDIYITIKAHHAQQEREKIINRINQGLAVAKEKGTKLGRPKTEVPDKFKKEYLKFKNGDYGDMSVMKFAKMMGIARSTCYKYIDLLKDNEQYA